VRGRLGAIFVACLVSVLHAQGTQESTVEISGRVTDSVTGRGVSGALVVLYASLTKAQLGAQPGQGATARPPGAPSQTLTDGDGVQLRLIRWLPRQQNTRRIGIIGKRLRSLDKEAVKSRIIA
jgi:hypothetical protein